MQADNLHPNERGQPGLLDNVWPRLRPLLRAVAPPRKAG
jgi:acyl-CoA thioesterase-1